ncbi:hypothetical protein [Acetobacter cibinongensis]|uniref:hypothetical protein n=1 Tax=Acetobacter cibinongensis TaxID=146475 RepID=UPI000A3AE7B3|nr:hypothetical protein [Acetobacter cibinongensis]
MPVRTHFSQDTLDTLFDAILENDVADSNVTLPAVIPANFSDDQVTQCFNLCQQLWLEGIAPQQLVRLANTILWKRDLSEQERVAFKHIRAKYKHMGFAFILYTPAHKRPFLYEATSTIMGEVQDAFRNGLKRKILLLGGVMRLLVSGPFQKTRQRLVEQARLDTTQAFNRMLKAEIGKIPAYLNEPSITSAQFHALRKIVSRHVSFFDTLRTLYPSADNHKMSRFLSAINGLMGRMHDDLISQSVSGQLNYHKDKIVVPEIISRLLTDLATAYPKV